MDQNMLEMMMARMGLTPDDVRGMQENYARMTGLPTNRGPPTLHPGMSKEELEEAIPRYREWLEEDNKAPPEPAPYIPREDLIANHARLCQEQRQQSRGREVMMRMTITGYPKHSSITPIERLRRTTFDEMLVRKVHLGRFLLCRSITPAVRLASVQLVVEDLEGITHGLSLYNFPTAFECSLSYLDFLFPVGVILAIREPTFKTSTQGGAPLIRVDSPTDVVFVGPHSNLLHGITWRSGSLGPRLPAVDTVDSWKDKGNALFKNSHWLPAAIAYSRGLELDPDAVVLCSNRAEAYLRLGFYSGAVTDAKRVRLSPYVPDAVRDKALFREAKAEYARGNYAAAETHFLRWQQAHSDHKEVADWIARTKERQAESKTGQYDWARLFSLSQTKPHLDVADYSGPVRVTEMVARGGGRGMVATQEIEMGDLIMVSKPFVSVFKEDLHPEECVLSVDMLGSAIYSRCGTAIVPFTVQKLIGNPDLHDFVFHLYAGPDFDLPPPSYPPKTLEEPLPVNPVTPQIDIDMARLEAIFSYNKLTPAPLEPEDIRSREPSDRDSASGLYVLSSLFNNACDGNASWYCVGDVMVIRARTRIATGEEITLPYMGNATYPERRKRLSHFLGGNECDCKMCQDDRKDDDAAHDRREELLSTAKLKLPPVATLRKLEEILAATYSPSRGPYRREMAEMQHIIAETLRSHGTSAARRDAIKQEVKVLQSLGFVVKNGGSDEPSQPVPRNDSELPIETKSLPPNIRFQFCALYMLRIAEDYLALTERAEARKWLLAAQWVITSSVGGGKDLFLKIMRLVLREWNLLAFAQSVL